MAMPSAKGLFHRAIDRAFDFVAGIGQRALVGLLAMLVLFIALKWWQRRRFYRTLRMARITAAELHGLLQKDPPPVVLDVRTSSTRRSDPRRIPGARAFELAELDGVVAGLPPGAEIVLYCT